MDPQRCNPEVLMYVKYRISRHSSLGTVVICPPSVDEWAQVCMFLGHPLLQENEADFIYGGTEYQLPAMEREIDAYFHDLIHRGVVVSFERDAQKRGDSDTEIPVGGAPSF